MEPEGVSMFGAFAPYCVWDSDETKKLEETMFDAIGLSRNKNKATFVSVSFLRPDGTPSNHGKQYWYRFPNDKNIKKGDRFHIDSTLIEYRRSDEPWIVTQSSIKKDPYGDSVVEVVKIMTAYLDDDFPDELEVIDEAGSWVSILSFTITDKNYMEGNTMMDNNFLKGMFGPISNGMCKITMDGGIAVKTSNGYKSYNAAQGTFINCDNFVFSGFDEMFFVVPTNTVAAGDIIFANGKPKYVLKMDTNILTVVNYENGAVEQMLPERHMFMGNTYFYGKIVSMFGNADNLSGPDGMNKIMRVMMMSQMMNGSNGKGNDGMNPMMMMMMMGGGGFGNIFDNIFGAAPSTPAPAPAAAPAPAPVAPTPVTPVASTEEVK